MRQLLDKFRKLLTPADKFAALRLLAAMCVGAGLEVIGISVLMPVVAVLSKPELLTENRYLRFFYGHLNPGTMQGFLLVMCGIVIVFYLLKNAFLTWMTGQQSAFIYRKAESLARRLYANYINTAYPFHLRHNSSELLNNINQLEQIISGVLLPLLLILSELAVIAALTAVLLIFTPWSTLCAGTVLLLVAAALYWPLRKYSTRTGEIRYRAGQEIFQCIMQGIGGIKETKVNNCEAYFIRCHDAAQHRFCTAGLKLYFTGQLPRLFLESFIVMLAMAVIMVFVWCGTPSGTILLSVTLMAAALFRLLPSVSRIQYNFVRIRQSFSAFDAVFRDLTGLVPENTVPPESVPPVTFQHAIRFESVNFGYAPDQPPLFHRFSLEIPRLASVALVGTTGCGKSTLVDLMLGLLKPDAGKITVDGRDIEENLVSWRSLTGYVPQFIYLADGTIRENVAFGIPPEEIDDERVWECLKTAQLDGFAASLPGGLSAEIGERGTRLSGGQRQRIGIARALYRKPEVLILDEATSALDNETERAFVEALNALKGKMTLVMIAHRLSTVEKCDRIIRL